MAEAKAKKKVAVISVLSNTVLTSGKLVVGLMMGSVSIISEALHSGLDLIASLVAFFSVRQSEKPADDVHRFGHGKFENLAALVEALLILVAAGIIISHAVTRLIQGGEVESVHLGLWVMGISAAVNFFVSTLLMRTAKQTESPALEADAWHLRTDVYTSLGVFIGMICIQLTGISLFDPLIALVVALLIIKAAIDLLRKSFGSILDVRLSDEEENHIKEILYQYKAEYVGFHKLRTRRAGSQRYVDLHLVVPRKQRIYVTHDLCQRIEIEMAREIREINVLIHAEPCEPEYCAQCSFVSFARDVNSEIKQGDCEHCTWNGCG